GFSPDCKSLLVQGPAARVPADWERYNQSNYRGGPAHMRAARSHPDGPDARNLHQFYIVDVNSGAVRPLWNAPALWAIKAAWSPDSRRLALAPTNVPPQPPATAAPSELAVAVVNVS